MTLRVRRCTVNFIIDEPWALPSVDWTEAADHLIRLVSERLAATAESVPGPTVIRELSCAIPLSLDGQAGSAPSQQRVLDGLTRATSGEWATAAARALEQASAVGQAHGAIWYPKPSDKDDRIRSVWRLLELTRDPLAVRRERTPGVRPQRNRLTLSTSDALAVTMEQSPTGSAVADEERVEESDVYDVPRPPQGAASEPGSRDSGQSDAESRWAEPERSTPQEGSRSRASQSAALEGAPAGVGRKVAAVWLIPSFGLAQADGSSTTEEATTPAQLGTPRAQRNAGGPPVSKVDGQHGPPESIPQGAASSEEAATRLPWVKAQLINPEANEATDPAPREARTTTPSVLVEVPIAASNEERVSGPLTPQAPPDHATAGVEDQSLVAAGEVETSPAPPDLGRAPGLQRGSADSQPAGTKEDRDAQQAAPLPIGPRLEGDVPGDLKRPFTRSGRPRVRRGELSVPSVLPFLMLWPLEDLGLLDAIAEAFDDELRDLLPVMAYALAQKALPPREAGWLRDPAYDMTAAAFAGLPEPPDGYALEAIAHTASRWAPSLVLAVADAVLASRNPEDPLVAVPVGESRLAVATADACMPLAWTATVTQMRDLWWTAGSPSLLVHDADNLGLLSSLKSIDVSASLATDETESIVGLYTTMKELSDRPGSPRAESSDCEDALGLIAGCALSELARRLWHDVRPTDAALAIEWLGDLDGDVSLLEGAISLSLPAGPRSAAVRDALYRASISAPWLQP